MKSHFPGYYQPREEEFKGLWKTAVFALDANVLLNFYRYSPETLSELLEILSKISDRIWIPHQAALEFQKRRLSVISNVKNAYKKLEEALDDALKTIQSKFNAYRRHPNFHVEDLITQIKRSFSRIVKKLQFQAKQHPDYFEHDPIREDLTGLLEGKVGEPFPHDRLKEIYKEGEKRYVDEIPPGYKDAKKKLNKEKYGDLILWNQIIKKAEKDKTGIIFITDDNKEDWWWVSEGKKIGPRPELVEEIHRKASVLFYMYPPERFMDYAREYLAVSVKQESIDEVHEISEQTKTLHEIIERGFHVNKTIADIIRQENLRRSMSAHLIPNLSDIVKGTLTPQEYLENMRTAFSHPADAVKEALRHQEILKGLKDYYTNPSDTLIEILKQQDIQMNYIDAFSGLQRAIQNSLKQQVIQRSLPDTLSKDLDDDVENSGSQEDAKSYEYSGSSGEGPEQKPDGADQ